MHRAGHDRRVYRDALSTVIFFVTGFVGTIPVELEEAVHREVVIDEDAGAAELTRHLLAAGT
jgi:hypothetical protein